MSRVCPADQARAIYYDICGCKLGFDAPRTDAWLHCPRDAAVRPSPVVSGRDSGISVALRAAATIHDLRFDLENCCRRHAPAATTKNLSFGVPVRLYRKRTLFSFSVCAGLNLVPRLPLVFEKIIDHSDIFSDFPDRPLNQGNLG